MLKRWSCLLFIFLLMSLMIAPLVHADQLNGQTIKRSGSSGASTWDLQNYSADTQALNSPQPQSPGTTSRPGPAITTLTPTLRWSDASNVNSFLIQIRTYPHRDNDLIIEGDFVAGRSYQVPPGTLRQGQEYSWRVARVTYGGLPWWSAPLYFNTQAEPVKAPTIKSITPTDLQASSSKQKLSIHGSDFKHGLTVRLRDPKNKIHVFSHSNYPGLSVTANRIDLKAEFNLAGRWQVNVTNPDQQVSNIYSFAVKPKTIDSVTLTASPPNSQRAGGLIVFRAEASGGITDAEFAFYYKRPGRIWTLGRSYSTNPAWVRSTNYLGPVEIGVLARSVGSSRAEAKDSINYRIEAVSPVAEVELTADPPQQQDADEPVTFTAQVTEGNQDAEFRFYYLKPGDKWACATGYSTKNSWTISTGYTGQLEVGVLARAVGSGRPQAKKIIDYEIIKSEESNKFEKGDLAKTTINGLKVRDDQGNEKAVTLPKGIVGQVVAGPVDREVGGQTHTFWKINWKWNFYSLDLVGWSAEDYLEKPPGPDNDLYWLARMIMSEASVGTDIERAAVGWTAINRSKIDINRFGGGTIFGVVSKWQQYSLKQEPSAEIIRLAERILKGEISDPAKDHRPATHFFSPQSMIPTNFKYIVPNDGSVPAQQVGATVSYPSWARPAGEIKEDTREYVTADGNKRWVQRDNIRNWYYMVYNHQRYKITATLDGPGELRLSDSEGRVTGLIDGLVHQEIYDSQYKDGSVVIEYPGDSYQYLVAGTKSGHFDLHITIEGAEEDHTLSFTDIATVKGALHKCLIDWGVLAEGKKQPGITLKKDTAGDGKFEEVNVDYYFE